MNRSDNLRILHSFPHRLGMGRICTTAWREIEHTAALGAELTVLAGDSVRPFSHPVKVTKTLRWGRLTVSYRLFGVLLMCKLHDFLVARQLQRLRGKIDIIHAWPAGALLTIRTAKKLGIPVALERCNAHTRFAYEVVQAEARRIKVVLPKNAEHSFTERTLRHEEAEFEAADALLCPSEFVTKTYRDRGFSEAKLERFIYGVDDRLFHPGSEPSRERPLRAIFVGYCAIRKGLHLALEAWIQSSASQTGEFLIAGDFLPEYRQYLQPLLSHPSVRILGQRNDIPELLRDCDLMVFPSLEEGFGLVVTEAMASGCVPLISDACTDLCRHQVHGLVHHCGDVAALRTHIEILHRDRALLSSLRARCIQDTPQLNWTAAGASLLSAYTRIIARYHGSREAMPLSARAPSESLSA